MKKLAGQLVAVTLCGVLLAGCANPYAKFYQGAPDARANPRYVAPPGPVQVFALNDIERDRDNLMRRGYIQVGFSSFQAGSSNATQAQLIEQAQKLGAEIVLANTKYSHTVSGVMPLTLPTTSTTYSNAHATAFGSNGTSATAFGSGTSTTYGTQTTMVPYSADRSDFGAVYFARVRPRLGIYVKPLTDEMRQARSSNTGVIIYIVVDNSPAFAADILPGDILVAINGENVAGVEGFNQIVAKPYGQQMKLTLGRGDKTVEKVVSPLP